MACRDAHEAARKARTSWPRRDALQKATKGQYALHSQSIQMVCHAFLANIEATVELRKAGNLKMKYPWRDKRYYPLLWPAQAVAVTARHIILPMGRGRASIVLPKPEGFVPGACKLVWNGSANELHVTVEVSAEAVRDSKVVATVDLGQIHQCAVTTSTGAALIVSGRGQRSLKRLQSKMHGQIARLQSRCKKGSRRHKKLARARHKHAGRLERQVRDLAHKGTRAVADFCASQDVGIVFIGDPHGVRKKRNGRKHNQRMAQWEYGRDKNYLAQKLGRAGIASCDSVFAALSVAVGALQGGELQATGLRPSLRYGCEMLSGASLRRSFTGSERGTSSRCPQCGHKHKPKGRVWSCKACGFKGHRDLVGSVNMHEDNFEKLTTFPSLQDVTYLRPRSVSMEQAGRMKTCRLGSSSRPDTGHEEKSLALLSERRVSTTRIDGASIEAGHRATHSTEAHRL